MDLWNVAEKVTNIFSHVPIERFIFDRRGDSLDRLEKRLKEQGLLNPATKSTVTISPAQTTALDIPSDKPRGGLSREETTLYQNRELGKLLLLMEKHYAQKMRINGIPCDCGAPKHLLHMEALAEETIPMVSDSAIYYRLMDWIQKVGPKSTEGAALSGQYDEGYPQMSYQARDFRKEIIGSLEPSALFSSKGGGSFGIGILPVVSDAEKEKIKEVAHRRIEEVLR